MDILQRLRGRACIFISLVPGEPWLGAFGYSVVFNNTSNFYPIPTTFPFPSISMNTQITYGRRLGYQLIYFGGDSSVSCYDHNIITMYREDIRREELRSR
jgi:hypothetical protein